MNTRSIKILTLLTVIAGAAGRASAADQASPWSLSILGGDSIGESGSLRSPTRTTFGDLGSLDPSLAGIGGTVSLDRLKYEDLFRRRFDTGLELNYSLSDNLQSYGRFSYDALGGRTRSIGELTSESFDTPANLNAHFADADNMSLEFGSRYFWSTGSNWRPFAGVALGATHLDSMRASLTSPDAAIDLNNVRFTRSGTVFSQSLETGVEFNPTDEFGVRLSVDASHFGTPPSGDDSRLATLGFNPGDDAHSLWSFPVSIAANYRF